MTKTSKSAGSEDIEGFVLKHVVEHPTDIARVAAERFGISRQAINRHLARMVEQGKLSATGSTRSRRYEPAVLVAHEVTLDVSSSLQEDRVWSEHVAPLLADVPKNVRDICFYGFTEMLNNVVDHSDSKKVAIYVRLSAVEVGLVIIDKGVGIFRKLASVLGLDDERHAILELSKGKLTTDPKRHSGEGIFFTSRMFDDFNIVSGSLALVCVNGESWLLDTRERWLDTDNSFVGGTAVTMIIDPHSKRTTSKVFDQYSDKGADYGFTRTHVPVVLAQYGDENLLSRSQAKRLLARFDRFKEVLLDFKGVQTVGQAFADEIFRVFQNEHPDIRLTWTNAAPEVERMIRRALGGRTPPAAS